MLTTAREVNPDSALGQLAQLVGISPSYELSNHAIAPATEHAVTDVMQRWGIACSTDEECQASLTARQLEAAERGLPLNIVCREDGWPATTSFVLSESAEWTELTWKALGDGGFEYEQKVERAALPAPEELEIDGHRFQRFNLVLDGDIAIGMYDLVVTVADLNPKTTKLFKVPDQCYQPPILEKQKIWGVSTLMNGLHSENSVGCGEFYDILELARQVAPLGAGTVAVSPLLALLRGETGNLSPYTPSSRMAYDVYRLTIEQIPEFHTSEVAQALFNDNGYQDKVRRVREEGLVDGELLLELKNPIFEELFKEFRLKHLVPHVTDRGLAFISYCKERGLPLDQFATYQVVGEIDEASAHTRSFNWRQFAGYFNAPDHIAVQAATQTHSDRIWFYKYLDFLCDEQLAEVARAIKEDVKLPAGIYLDLPVGCNIGGAESWADQAFVDPQLLIGAAPDVFPDESSDGGQKWGMPLPRPDVLQGRHYQPLIDLYGFNMRHADILRDDHVGKQRRLFGIPNGHTIDDGIFVNYPVEEVIGIIALLSHQHKCMMVGEDIGTMHPELRQTMDQFGMFGFEPLPFARTPDNSRFLGPSEMRANAVGMPSYQDRPPLASWWSGRDIEIRTEIGQLTDGQPAEERARRVAERRQLLESLQYVGIDVNDYWAQVEQNSPEMSQDLLLKVVDFCGRGESRILLVDLPDLELATEPQNIAGDFGNFPSFRRKHATPVNRLNTDSLANRVAEQLTSREITVHT